jgi:hypothetical protein
MHLKHGLGWLAKAGSTIGHVVPTIEQIQFHFLDRPTIDVVLYKLVIPGTSEAHGSRAISHGKYRIPPSQTVGICCGTMHEPV